MQNKLLHMGAILLIMLAIRDIGLEYYWEIPMQAGLFVMLFVLYKWEQIFDETEEAAEE